MKKCDMRKILSASGMHAVVVYRCAVVTAYDFESGGQVRVLSGGQCIIGL